MNMSSIPLNTFLQGDALEILKTLPDSAVNCCVTSPPYYNLRVDKQMGSTVPGRDPTKAKKPRFDGRKYTANPDVFNRTKSGSAYEPRARVNKRSVWTMSTARYLDAHFATFPPELPRLCISAGCPKGGVALDPFSGSGTTSEVAYQLERSFIGIEINPDYVALSSRRLDPLLAQQRIEYE
jgi:DNA modification methylase